MTVRKQFVLVTFVVILFAVSINSIISTTYIDNYFQSFINDQYGDNVKAVVGIAQSVLEQKDSNTSRTQRLLSDLVNEPIVAIAIYDNNGTEVVASGEAMYMMHRGMRMDTMFDTALDNHVVLKNGVKIGEVRITRVKDIASIETVQLFKSAILVGALLSGGGVAILAIFMTYFAAGKITKDLRETAQFGKAIELGNEVRISPSNILEIKGLQISLQNLASKLKVQQYNRKKNVDQLAHESRTPLAILKSHCEGALDKVVVMDNARLESCLSEIDNLSILIENITEIIEYQGDQAHAQLSTHDVVLEVKKVMKGLSVQFERKGIELTYSGPKHLSVATDATFLNQVMYNLLTNAYKFTETGEVHVSLSNSHERKKWTISISDTGCGISEDESKKIFEAYYRGKQAFEIPGDGLGLHIVKENVGEMGGDINLQSKFGEGSKFTLEFPYEVSESI